MVRSPRILVTVDPVLPVPPAGYGGTHRVAASVVTGLVAAGHHVTVLAAPGSQLAGARVVIQRYRYPAPRWLRAVWYLTFAVRVARLARRTDALLSFWREDFLRGILPSDLPTVLTHHDPIDDVPAPPTRRTLRISVSDDQRAGLEDARWRTIHNGVDTDRLIPYAGHRGGYVAFLGRLSPEKGVDTAIRACRRAGIPLRIGGNVPDSPVAREYFDRMVGPWLGTGVEWLGELDNDAKRELLGGADALIFPIRWREPFGLVMAEALACGTPVIALRGGSTPEVVRDGVTGFVRDNEEGLVEALGRIGEIDRERCRAEAVARFSEARMVAEYLDAVRSIIRDSV